MTEIERVLFPTDFSGNSRAALAYATQWAEAFGAELHLLHVRVLHDLQGNEEKTFPAFSDYFEALNQHTGELMDRLLETRASDSLEVHRATRRGTAAAPEILAYADETAADMIVMATHGRRGLRKLFLGSVTEEVVRHAKVPVLTVRGEATPPAESEAGSIAVAVDFSSQSEAAVAYASRISSWTGAEVHLLHVVELPRPAAIYDVVPETPQVPFEDVAGEARERLGQIIHGSLDPDRTSIHVLEGTPASRILEWLDEHDPDLLIQGSHGRTGTARFLLGSVAERVVNQATCPVLTVKGEPSAGEG